MSIIKWFNRKFRGVVYAEDSLPMDDNEFGVFLNMTPHELELVIKQKETGFGHSVFETDHWYQD